MVTISFLNTLNFLNFLDKVKLKLLVYFGIWILNSKYILLECLTSKKLNGLKDNL